MKLSAKTGRKICALCGRGITSAPSAIASGKHLCESCYLDARSVRTELIQEEAALAEALASALDLREHETGLHSKRVACHTLELARHAVPDEPSRLRQVYWGALLHDVGKIGIPDAILLKQGPLTDVEWEVMHKHPEMGHRIVVQVPGMLEAADIVLCHEERFDGSGYPNGLEGEAIPWGARLFAIIDTLDAMTSDRPYRKGLDFDAARKEILRMSGTQFDPAAVEIFLAKEEVLRKMVLLKCGTASAEDIFIQSTMGG